MLSRVKMVSVASLLVVVAIGIAYGATVLSQERGVDRPTADKQLTQPGYAVTRAVTLTPEKRRDLAREWASRQKKYSSAAEVLTAFNERARVPSQTSDLGTPDYYVSPDRTTYSAVWGEPGSSVYLTATKKKGEPDYDAEIRESVEMKGPDGSGPFLKKIAVVGNEGLGAEPGFNLVQGEKYEVPAFVKWWENGVEYELHGRYGADDTMGFLLGVAEAMY